MLSQDDVDNLIKNNENATSLSELNKSIADNNIYIAYDKKNKTYNVYNRGEIQQRIYHQGLNPSQMSEMGLGDRQQLQEDFKEVIAVHDMAYDKRNLRNIQKDVLEGMSPTEAIKKIAGKNQGEFNHLMQLYKSKGEQIQNDLIKQYEQMYNYDTDYENRTDFWKAVDKAEEEEIGKLDNWKEDLYRNLNKQTDFYNQYPIEIQDNVPSTGEGPASKSEYEAIDKSYEQQLTNIWDGYSNMRNYYDKIKNDKNLSNEEKLKLYKDLPGSYSASVQKENVKQMKELKAKMDQRFWDSKNSMRGISDEEMHADDARWYDYALNPLEAYGHYKQGTQMKHSNPSSGYWDGNTMLDAIDFSSYFHPVTGFVRGAQMLGKGVSGLVDVAEKFDKTGNVDAMDFLNPAINLGFGRFSMKPGMANFKKYFPGKNSTTIYPTKSIDGLRQINLPGGRTFKFGNPMAQYEKNLAINSNIKPTYTLKDGKLISNSPKVGTGKGRGLNQEQRDFVSNQLDDEIRYQQGLNWRGFEMNPYLRGAFITSGLPDVQNAVGNIFGNSQEKYNTPFTGTVTPFGSKMKFSSLNDPYLIMTNRLNAAKRNNLFEETDWETRDRLYNNKNVEPQGQILTDPGTSMKEGETIYQKKKGGVIKIPKRNLGGQNNTRILNDLDRFLRDDYSSKKYSKSLAATNSVFAINDLFKKPSRNRIYNPNARYFKKGGAVQLPKARDGRITNLLFNVADKITPEQLQLGMRVWRYSYFQIL